VKYLCSYIKGFFNMPQNLMIWGRRLYFPSEGRRCRFLLPFAGFEPTNLGSSGNDANHYITENCLHLMTN
jgi:hypothetical protein